MKVSQFGRYVISSCVAAALLAGCGGSQTPIDVAGAMAYVSTGSTAVRADSLPYNKTFNYTGKRQRFTVPAGVKWLTVVARGASGGSNPSYKLGGRGGRMYAVIPVTPGERLAVLVGGVGSQHGGGFNGGASGGVYGFSGQGGGGASDVRQGGERIANRILVAGGGGGQGAPLFPGTCGSELRPQSAYQPPDGNGGKGGGSTGGPGQTGGPCYTWGGGGGGAGGSQYHGGFGGAGGQGIGNPGNPGSLYSGGTGGAGCHGSLCQAGEPGGGGGGGYYGGGGGGAGNSNDLDAFGGGGGGGGSSYIEPSAQKFQSWQGWKNATGDGLVVFSWK